MSKSNKSSRALNTVVESIKDVTVSNFLSAYNSKKFELSPKSLDLVLSLLKASVDQGYQNSYRAYMREVADEVKEDSDAVKKK